MQDAAGTLFTFGRMRVFQLDGFVVADRAVRDVHRAANVPFADRVAIVDAPGTRPSVAADSAVGYFEVAAGVVENASALRSVGEVLADRAVVHVRSPRIVDP